MTPVRLRASADIRAAFASRHSAHARTLVAHARDRGDRTLPPRTAVVAGRKVGKAVDRNRAKRRLRAVVAERPPRDGLDVVVVGRPTTVTAPFPELQRDWASAIARLESATTEET